MLCFYHFMYQLPLVGDFISDPYILEWVDFCPVNLTYRTSIQEVRELYVQYDTRWTMRTKAKQNTKLQVLQLQVISALYAVIN